jgi:hypothetical protein
VSVVIAETQLALNLIQVIPLEGLLRFYPVPVPVVVPGAEGYPLPSSPVPRYLPVALNFPSTTVNKLVTCHPDNPSPTEMKARGDGWRQKGRAEASMEEAQVQGRRTDAPGEGLVATLTIPMSWSGMLLIAADCFCCLHAMTMLAQLSEISWPYTSAESCILHARNAKKKRATHLSEE